MISVDTKKKGEFHNGGLEYQPTGSPVRVNVYDFPDPEPGKAIPYGIYDVAANTGWVSPTPPTGGGEVMMHAYRLLDLTARGRHEEWEEPKGWVPDPHLADAGFTS